MNQRQQVHPALLASMRREGEQWVSTTWRMWRVLTVSQTLETVPTGKTGDLIFTMLLFL